jgi:hypothetical protein
VIAFLIALASPTPRPALDDLKTITSIRATPFCSALRTRIGPAIASILDGDAIIAKGANFFADTRRASGYELRQAFQRLRLENGISPLVNDIAAARSQLDGLPNDARYFAMKQRLAAVLESQNDALNAISGYLATQAMNDLRNAGIGPARRQVDSARYPRITPYQAAAKAFWDAADEHEAAETAASQEVLSAVTRCAASTP